MCKLIAIEGLNGAGKTVLCSQIVSKLQKQGYRVLSIKAPIYEIQQDQIDHYGPDIYSYLNNGKSFDLAYVDYMFKVNRQYIQDHIIIKNVDIYDYILIDRWSMSGIVYGYFRREMPRLRSISDEIPMFNMNQTEEHLQLNVQQHKDDLGLPSCLTLSSNLINEDASSFNVYLTGRCQSLDCKPLLDCQPLLDDIKNSPFKHSDLQYSKLNKDMSQLFGGIAQTDIQYIPLSNSGEILPDLTIFIDTDINEILYRIQARHTCYIDKQSTNKQIYSSIEALSQIRHIFRCFINQHIHRQNIVIIQNSDQIKDIINKLNDQVNKIQPVQTIFGVN